MTVDPLFTPPVLGLTGVVDATDSQLWHFTVTNAQGATLSLNYGDGTTDTVPTAASLTFDHRYDRGGEYHVVAHSTAGGQADATLDIIVISVGGVSGTSTAAYFTEPEQVIEYLVNLLETNQETVGLKFVGWGQERLIPEYPAALVVPGQVQRNWHSTHKWELIFLSEIWIYHAKLSDSHHTRTRDDLRLAMAVKNVVHEDLRLSNGAGPQCVMAWINAEDPAFIRRPPNDAVVGTRMEHTVLSQETFKSS
jgi:hypothetical protein